MDNVLTSSQGVVISAVGWIITGVVAWMAMALVVAVLVGGMIRRRDRQVPTDTPRRTARGHSEPVPEQRGPVRVPGVAGRDRRHRD